MSLGILLEPAGVKIATLIRCDTADQLAQKICTSWEKLEPQLVTDYDPQLHPETHHIIVDKDNTYYQQLTAGVDKAYERFHLVRHTSDEQAQESLVTQITVTMITSLVGQVQMFHAAALGDSATGRALALVAESGTGKTTASRLLGKHLTYLTDETVIVGENYQITPYLKPLSVIVDTARPKEQVAPSAAGLKMPERGQIFTLTRLIVLARDKSTEHREPALVPLTTADALLAITSQTSGLAKTERGVEKLIQLIRDCGGAFRLEYSEIEETLPLLQDLLAQKPQPAPEDVPYEVLYSQNLPPAAGKIAQAAQGSGYRLGERVLLMKEFQLTEVSFFAGDIWFELKEPASRAELHSRLEELYEQDIPCEALKDNIDALIKLGALVEADQE